MKNNAYQTEGIEPPIFDFALEEGGKIYPKYDGNKINLRLCDTFVTSRIQINCYAFDSLGAQYQKETHAADIDDYGSTDLEDYGILISAFKPLRP